MGTLGRHDKLLRLMPPLIAFLAMGHAGRDVAHIKRAAAVTTLLRQKRPATSDKLPRLGDYNLRYSYFFEMHVVD